LRKKKELMTAGIKEVWTPSPEETKRVVDGRGGRDRENCYREKIKKRSHRGKKKTVSDPPVP